MTGKYGHIIVNLMLNQHDSSSSLPTLGQLYIQRAEKNLYNNFPCLFVTSYWNSLYYSVVQDI